MPGASPAPFVEMVGTELERSSLTAAAGQLRHADRFPHRRRRGACLRAAVLFGGAGLAAAEHRPAAADAAALAARRARLGLAAGAVGGRCRRAVVHGAIASLPFAVGYFLALGVPVGAGRLSCLSEPPEPARPEAARVVSGGPPARGHVALRRRAAGAGAAADRRQLRGPARAHGRVLPAPFGPRRRELGMQPLSDGADRGAGRVRRRRPAGGPGGLLALPSSPSTSISPAASPAPRAASGATGRTCRRSPIRRASRCSSAWRLRHPSRRARSGVAGTSFSGALLVAYLIAGLALMHFIARGRAPWLLWLVYGGLSSCSVPTRPLALTLAGLLEPVLKLKRRFGASPPST